ncbi:MAG: aldehyde dehydrogenase family protein [Polyangiaceae bacterium]|nr:aldehyde dehydrogenase family protein [Polyangiaceae bacterium]
MLAPAAQALLQSLGLQTEHLPGAGGIDFYEPRGPEFISENPATAEVIGTVRSATLSDYERLIAESQHRFIEWRMRPAPARAEVVRTLGNLLRTHKEALGELISIEVGKIRSEGLGEVQEMIDICDFAIGLSRQLHGLVIASERPGHRMMEQWHPLGPVAIVTAFNFPMAVWAWNAMIAAVCGDTCIWKPSPLAPLCAIAVHALCQQAMKEHNAAGLFGLCAGPLDLSKRMADDKRFPLVSFTGSIEAGRSVAARVAERLGKSILELGGNNAIIVLKDADIELAARAITFGAVGTAGQRCTTTRRIFVQKEVMQPLLQRLVRAYKTIAIGDPLKTGTLLGPLISERAAQAFDNAIARALALGGTVMTGGKRVPGQGHFVEPTIILGRDHNQFDIAWQETFAPILYVFECEGYDDAIGYHNAVPQGLSSAIFTDSIKSAETFLSAKGSDCGIANVNIGTSGAEIGGAFGGEKDTGGGRESGSDAWKGYMRRQTCTLNWSGALPLAQGVKFDIE